MIHDPKHLAIALTAIGVKSQLRDYSFLGVNLYTLQGDEFIVQDGDSKQVFSDAYDAAEAFANIIWNKQTKEA